MYVTIVLLYLANFISLEMEDLNILNYSFEELILCLKGFHCSGPRAETPPGSEFLSLRRISEFVQFREGVK